MAPRSGLTPFDPDPIEEQELGGLVGVRPVEVPVVAVLSRGSDPRAAALDHDHRIAEQVFELDLFDQRSGEPGRLGVEVSFAQEHCPGDLGAAHHVPFDPDQGHRRRGPAGELEPIAARLLERVVRRGRLEKSTGSAFAPNRMRARAASRTGAPGSAGRARSSARRASQAVGLGRAGSGAVLALGAGEALADRSSSAGGAGGSRQAETARRTSRLVGERTSNNQAYPDAGQTGNLHLERHPGPADSRAST